MIKEVPNRTRRIAIALSGGGHRASLFGLGVLLYLTDAGVNRSVISVSSVSGGSLTNAWIAQGGDYSRLATDGLARLVSSFVRRVAHRGTLWASWTTWVYLVTMIAGFLAVVALWWLPVDVLVRTTCFLLGLAGWSVYAQLRNRMCARALQKTLYSSDGSPTLLRDIRRTNVQHVICATDVRVGHHVYFSGGFVCSYRLGWGCPAELSLADAVQVSAAFPGAFPPRWLKTTQHRFLHGSGKTPSFMALSDGGIYDNMAEQWPIGIPARKRRWPSHCAALQEPNALVVVDASGPMQPAPVRWLRIPALGEAFGLLRTVRILYHRSTATRRKALVDQFDRAARGERGSEGALIMINRSPYWTADHFSKQSETWPDRAERAARVLQMLGDENRRSWKRVVDENLRVKTTLSRLGGDAAASLLLHGYVSAMANLHVVLGFPLLTVPSRSRFRELAAREV